MRTSLMRGTTSPRAGPAALIRGILCPVFLAAVCLSSGTAQEHIVFDHLSVRQGLSQADVNCMLQDSRGFMWIGTQDGLNRFDGYTFRVYRHDAAVPGSLTDSWIISLAETPDGTLWVGTLGNPGTLNRFDPVNEMFAPVPRDSAPMKGARMSAIRPSFEDAFGENWSGTIGGGLTRGDPRTGKVTTFRHDPSDSGSIADDRVYTVTGDRRGDIWIGTHEGLDRYDRKTGTFVHYRHDEADPWSLSDNWVWPVFEDRTGTLWVGTIRGGLNRFDRASGRFTHFRHEESDPASVGNDRLYSLYQDASGLMWVGRRNTGSTGSTRNSSRSPIMRTLLPIPGASQTTTSFRHSSPVPASRGSGRGGGWKARPVDGDVHSLHA